jgi:hypothetical protein
MGAEGLILDVDAEFEALASQLAAEPGADPVELPEWLTDPEPKEDDIPVPGRHAKRYCPWTDVVVPEPTSSTAVEAAATTAMLDLRMGFIKSPTAKHAHDGTGLAMVEFAAAELRAALKQRSVPRGRLRDLLGKLEAML